MPHDATKSERRARATTWIVVAVVIVVLLALIFVLPRMLVDAHYASVRRRAQTRDRTASPTTHACPLASVR
jgi:flagellar basal body-associated protein FliL